MRNIRVLKKLDFIEDRSYRRSKYKERSLESLFTHGKGSLYNNMLGQFPIVLPPFDGPSRDRN
jgi:hypothetical protein